MSWICLIESDVRSFTAMLNTIFTAHFCRWLTEFVRLFATKCSDQTSWPAYKNHQKCTELISDKFVTTEASWFVILMSRAMCVSLALLGSKSRKQNQRKLHGGSIRITFEFSQFWCGWTDVPLIREDGCWSLNPTPYNWKFELNSKQKSSEVSLLEKRKHLPEIIRTPEHTRICLSEMFANVRIYWLAEWIPSYNCRLINYRLFCINTG